MIAARPQRRSVATAFLAVTLCLATRVGAADVQIASKAFTESVILAEIIKDQLASVGVTAFHRQGLGGGRLLWDALLAGRIDIYPEYTGTLTDEILSGERLDGEDFLEKLLAGRDIRISKSLGFDNNYALGMLEQKASQLGIRSISDLVRHPELRFGFSNEFVDRADGWPSLSRAYGLHRDIRGLDHDIAYKALSAGSVDVVDLYSTDAEITHYGIRLLDDDKLHFKKNTAVLLYRADLIERAPQAAAAMRRLEGAISAQKMIAMNESARFSHRSESAVAADFVSEKFGFARDGQPPGLLPRILKRTVEHLALTVSSLLMAIVVSVPLGVISAYYAKLGQIILACVSVLQTIPSLALLVFMIPLLGVGEPPAIAALFFYSLLPIVRNTASGLTNIAPPIRRSAIALGLSPLQRLKLIEFPLASPTILAGVKTAAVINVGTATLGALIGAGGYGQPILTGIRLDNFSLILEGAIPAALLALAVQPLFELAERRVLPRGVRRNPQLKT